MKKVLCLLFFLGIACGEYNNNCDMNEGAKEDISPNPVHCISPSFSPSPSPTPEECLDEHGEVIECESEDE